MRQPETDMDSLRLLKVEDVLSLIPISRAKLYRLIADGAFPKPRKIGAAAFWPKAAVVAWLEDFASKDSEDII